MFRNSSLLQIAALAGVVTAGLMTCSRSLSGRSLLKIGPLLNQIPDHAVFLLDTSGRIVTCNDTSVQITGYSRADLRRLPGHLLFSESEHEQEPFEAELAEARRSGRVATERWLVRRDGSRCWVDQTLSPIYCPGGRLIGYLKVARDLTTRKALQEQREELYREVQEINRAKDEFLSTISHELRTPLTSITGWAALLKSGKTDVLAVAADSIYRNALLEARLVDQILDLSRIITGKLEVDLRPIPVRPAVEQAVASCRVHAENKGVPIHVSLDSAAWISGNAQRLEQAITNILSNAIKFTPPGGEIALEIRDQAGVVTIAITDTGIGIRKESLAHIFEQFRQGDNSVTRRFGGLGLGLSLARFLVHAQQGAIEVESAGEGSGSRFTVKFPVLSVGREPVVI